MQTPVEIAYRHCEPSEELRAEINAQIRRLEKFGDRITSCRVVVEGPQTRHRSGEAFKVDLFIALPERKEVAVNRTHDAPEREHALVAIRQAFDEAISKGRGRQARDARPGQRAPRRRPRAGDEIRRGRRLRLHRNAGRPRDLFPPQCRASRRVQSNSRSDRKCNSPKKKEKRARRPARLTSSANATPSAAGAT